MENMVAVADAVPALTPEAEARLARAMAMTFMPEDGMDFAAAVARSARARLSATFPGACWRCPSRWELGTRVLRGWMARLRQSDELTLNLDGWEGPLDLLLNLARAQKVDLAQISILQLVEQYLTYLAEARALKLEIAADYLVMAAWLAYLKSCLLLPKDPEQDPSPEEIALRLQMRLQRLDAMREAGARLLGRDRIGRDVFLRGAPEGLRLVRKAAWQVTRFRPVRRLRRSPRADPAGHARRSCTRAGDDPRGSARTGSAG